MSVGGRQKLPQKLSGLPRDLAELFEGKGEGETERERLHSSTLIIQMCVGMLFLPCGHRSDSPLVAVALLFPA